MQYLGMYFGKFVVSFSICTDLCDSGKPRESMDLQLDLEQRFITNINQKGGTSLSFTFREIM